MPDALFILVSSNISYVMRVIHILQTKNRFFVTCKHEKMSLFSSNCHGDLLIPFSACYTSAALDMDELSFLPISQQIQLTFKICHEYAVNGYLQSSNGCF